MLMAFAGKSAIFRQVKQSGDLQWRRDGLGFFRQTSQTSAVDASK